VGFGTQWDPMVDLTITSSFVIVDSGFPSQRERSGARKVSPVGGAHLYLFANFLDMKGERRGGS
jgi:hypothetical protein